MRSKTVAIWVMMVCFLTVFILKALERNHFLATDGWQESFVALCPGLILFVLFRLIKRGKKEEDSPV
jgi:hypothetical protein